jgi:S1-C subfamily serine protease
MRYFGRAIATSLLVTACFAGAIYLIDKATDKRPGSTVRIEIPGGIGSGVHIGDGFIITAEHVVNGNKEVKVVTDAGATKYTADVLWMNEGFDVALIRLRGKTKPKTTPIACRAAVRGEAIEAQGNPFGLPFFVAQGTVAIATVDAADRWQEVIVVGVPIGAGMSGGPILDSRGYLLGITVASIGKGAAPFGLAVPVKTICGLLART